MFRFVLLVLAFAFLPGCLTTHPPIPSTTATVLLVPEVFFEGATNGLGVLRVRTRSPQIVRVTSHGSRQPDGSFELVQDIAIGDAPPRTRTWTMQRTALTTFTSSLTDAKGPVELEIDGSTLHVRYRMGSGTTMHQRLVLQPDGRTVLNLATVRWMGIPVARLTETITRAVPIPTQGSNASVDRQPR